MLDHAPIAIDRNVGILRKPRHAGAGLRVSEARRRVSASRHLPRPRRVQVQQPFSSPAHRTFSLSPKQLSVWPPDARRLHICEATVWLTVSAHPTLTAHLTHPQIRAFASGRKPFGFRPTIHKQLTLFTPVRRLSSRSVL